MRNGVPLPPCQDDNGTPSLDRAKMATEMDGRNVSGGLIPQQGGTATTPVGSERRLDTPGGGHSNDTDANVREQIEKRETYCFAEKVMELYFFSKHVHPAK